MPAPAWMQPIATTALYAQWAPERPWRLPPDPSVTLRGALGRAVMALACLRDHQDCAACDLAARCPVPQWYDPGRLGSHAPRPCVPAIDSPPDTLVCAEAPLIAKWWVLGPLPRPGLLVEALLRVGPVGIGADRVPHRLQRLMAQGQGGLVRVASDDQLEAPLPPPGSLASFCAVPASPRPATLTLRTPLQLKEAPRDRPPSPAAIVRALISRVRQAARSQGLSLDAWWPDPTGLGGTWEDLQWICADRQSSLGGRQDLSGWVGRLHLGPEAAPWADLLAAGEVLGAGRGLSAGRGRLAVAWAA